MPRNSLSLFHRIVFSLFFWMLSHFAFGQLSPGELSAVHSHLEGLSNCTRCHDLGKKVSKAKCLECHKEIRERVQASTGYHASLVVKNKECHECHSDHNGRKFQMIRIDTLRFNHRHTGYPLEGGHNKISCRSCHKALFITDPVLKKRKETFLGLEKRCASCHSDVHQPSLGVECQSCHKFESFRPAPLFKHNQTGFPLLGKHQTLRCQDCHPSNGASAAPKLKFKGLSHASCSDCHKDVHDGKLGKDCGKCHDESGFASARKTGSFNHTLTGFALSGKHSGLTCKHCHKGKLTDPLPHSQCRSCHADYHQKEFDVDGGKPDCSECHTTDGFAVSSFGIEEHNRSRFPLTGAHEATPCNSCHLKSDRWTFRNIGTSCTDCHNSVHEPGLRPVQLQLPLCNQCHTTATWSTVSYDHQQTKFPLTGAHIAVPCRNCHFPVDPVRQTLDFSFRSLSTECRNCHEDPHNGQFDAGNGIHCEKCHQTAEWKISNFDHNSTAFPLEGAHARLKCSACHPSVSGATRSFILYKTKKTQCADCHS